MYVTCMYIYIILYIRIYIYISTWVQRWFEFIGFRPRVFVGFVEVQLRSRRTWGWFPLERFQWPGSKDSTTNWEYDWEMLGISPTSN